MRAERRGQLAHSFLHYGRCVHPMYDEPCSACGGGSSHTQISRRPYFCRPPTQSPHHTLSHSHSHIQPSSAPLQPAASTPFHSLVVRVVQTSHRSRRSHPPFSLPPSLPPRHVGFDPQRGARRPCGGPVQPPQQAHQRLPPSAGSARATDTDSTTAIELSTRTPLPCTVVDTAADQLHALDAHSQRSWVQTVACCCARSALSSLHSLTRLLLPTVACCCVSVPSLR